MRKNTVRYKQLRLDLPEDLEREVRALLADPLSSTNRIKHGELRRINTMLWSNWVDQQRLIQAAKPPLKDL